MGKYSFTSRFSVVFLGSALAAGFAGCVSRGTDLAGFYSMPGYFTEVDFATVKAQVLAPKCISCHAEMETEEGTRAYLLPGDPARSSLYTEIVAGSMPPSGPKVSSSGAQLVAKYIIGLVSKPAGEPSPVPSDEPSPLPSPVPISYAQLKKAELQSRCIRCHDEMEKEDGLKEYVVPGNPEKSTLFTTVRDGEMPPGKPLPPAEIAKFRDYVISRGSL